MLKQAALIVLTLVPFTGCGSDVTEYRLSAETIKQFEANSKELAARDDYDAPLAMSVLDSNQVGAPESVQVWKPEAALRSVGIRNGDLIALIDGQVPSRDYKHSFAAGQKPFGSATEQYVHFVSGLFAQGKSKESTLLAVHARYGTNAERDKYSRSFAEEPRYIRIVFD